MHALLLSSQVVHPSLVYHQPHRYQMTLSVSQLSFIPLYINQIGP